MPIYGHNRIYIKEDYKFAKGGVCGTRGRMVYSLLNRVDDAGYTEVTYACGRNDVDLALVAQGCADFGFKCDIFTPNGDETPMMGAMAVLNKNLHYHQVAAIPLNWYADEESQQQIHGLLNIPPSQEVVAFIACGNPKEDFNLVTAKRRNAKEIVKYM